MTDVHYNTTVHKREVSYADTPITITGYGLASVEDFNLYHTQLHPSISDSAHTTWWLQGSSDSTHAPIALVTGVVSQSFFATRDYLRPMLTFVGGDFCVSDTFVFHDTNFLVVDDGKALATHCVGRSTYDEAESRLRQWFDDRINAKLNSVKGEVRA